jgi:uncharacterized protein (DUF697 family)
MLPAKLKITRLKPILDPQLKASEPGREKRPRAPVRIHRIIHGASAATAAIGSGMAQLPGSDAAAIVPVQTAMIIGIAHAHGVHIGEAVAAKLLLPFAATHAGRFVSQVLVGWMPGVGNVINATTAATITETIGWAANAYFAKIKPAPIP